MLTTVALTLTIALATTGQIEGRHHPHVPVPPVPAPPVPAPPAPAPPNQAGHAGMPCCAGCTCGMPVPPAPALPVVAPVVTPSPTLPLVPLSPHWRLADVTGQVWDHADKAWLEAFVGGLNAQMARPVVYYYAAPATVCRTCRGR